MSECLLEMRGITKVYSNNVVANDHVDFSLEEGEIHALVGENGAGKTTLMKILFGMERPTEGEILLRGKPLGPYNAKQAIEYGIGMVHQHFMLVDDFTVAENIMLGMEEQKGVFIDVDQCCKRVLEVSKKFNLDVDPYAITGTLPVGIKQKIEILKALIRGAKILILDEPTAVLTPQETQQLFGELEHLREMGYSIIFISHKIRELKQITSRMTIMRNGKNVGVFRTADISESKISQLIMGEDLKMDYDRPAAKIGEPIVRVRNLSYYCGQKKPILHDINFDVHAGSILGIAGVQGNGQVELVQLMTKERPMETGEIEICGQSIRHESVHQMRRSGYAYIPEDRLRQGVGASGSISDNLIANRYSDQFSRRGMLDKREIQQFSSQCITDYEIKCANAKVAVSTLSGGNMQKVVVARECSGDPKVIIAEQPTRGIDVGAAYVVHKKLFDLRDRGVAILLISADLSEVLRVCDQLMVMYDGEIVAYFDDIQSVQEEELGLYMLGLKRHTPDQIKEAIHA